MKWWNKNLEENYFKIVFSFFSENQTFVIANNIRSVTAVGKNAVLKLLNKQILSFSEQDRKEKKSHYIDWVNEFEAQPKYSIMLLKGKEINYL